jgi:ABC-type Fe3+-hydroxamate transport system substrate-binding protein
MAEAAGAIGSIFFQTKAVKEQKKAMKLEKQARELADARERRIAARQAVQQKAAVVNVAAQIGGGQGENMGSSVQGGLSNINNQLLSGLGFQAATQNIGNQITKANIAASKYLNFANISQGVGQAISSIGKVAMGAPK